MRIYLALALAIAISMNTLALYTIIKILRKYSSVKDGSKIERSMRKAYVSRKKKEIAVTQIKRIKSTVFRLSFYQFLIPMSIFIASIFIYIFAASIVYTEGNPLVLEIANTCIAPIPIQFPDNNRGTCSMQMSWIFFLVFLLYLPLYTYYAKKYLE
ncbi:MAG: hypothetical protein QW101_04350 [Ignisphaera sp.]|uniref:Uncharacterized protein n=1 Tax=Ignisphaera aggregans TaxID=334771 RepID=A0A7J3MY62_9CREN